MLTYVHLHPRPQAPCTDVETKYKLVCLLLKSISMEGKPYKLISCSSSKHLLIILEDTKMNKADPMPLGTTSLLDVLKVLMMSGRSFQLFKKLINYMYSAKQRKLHFFALSPSSMCLCKKPRLFSLPTKKEKFNQQGWRTAAVPKDNMVRFSLSWYRWYFRAGGGSKE